MVMLRRDRQPVGRREVMLTWMICVACRHVRLDQWTFVDENAGDENTRNDQHGA